jgi:tRNA(Ser,Leu) C12 N-acetylase TAN1
LKNVQKEKAFYFFTSIGNYSGINASSPREFLQRVKEIEYESVEFHLYRGDFQKWFREVWRFDMLADKIAEKEKQNLKGELLRVQVIEVVSNFLEALKEQTRKWENEANLLVTYDRVNRSPAQYEVKQTLKDVGEENPRFLHSRVRGLFRILIGMNPKEATKKLATLCREEPSKFWYTYNWIPVDEWCPSTLDEMSVIVKKFAKRILPEERWMIRVHKRFYKKYHTQELIEHLAELVDRPNVDLENPKKTIQIEIMGGKAALSLLGPREHLSVNTVKNEILSTKK